MGKMKNVGKAVLAATAIIGTAAIGAGIGVFELGKKFEAMDAKAQTVFGNQIGMVKQWADANAHAMGLTSREAVGLAANLGDLLVPLGFNRKEAAKMSTEVIGLSGALSEWSGGTRSAAEVADILQKGMLGERDALKELGISITDADVKTQLLADGNSKLTGKALEQAKAQATLELYMAKTTDAQTAYEKGTAKGVRTQAEMNAKMGEAVEKLVTALYPAMLTIVGVLADVLPKAIDFAGQAWATIGPTVLAVMSVIQTAFGVIMGVINTFVGLFKSGAAQTTVQATGIGSIIEKLRDTFGSVFNSIKSIVSGAVNIVTTIWKAFGSDIMSLATKAWSFIKSTIDNALDAVKAIFEIFAGAFTGDWSRMWNGVKSLVSAIWNQIGAVIKFAITGLIPAALSAGGTIIKGIITTLFNAVKTFITSIWNGILTVISNTVNTIGTRVKGAFNSIVSFIGSLPSRISNIASNMWNGIWNSFRNVINSIIRGWNSLSFSVPSIDVGPLGHVGGFTIGVPNIPYLHQGGMVPGTAGSDVLAILQAGEKVIPRNQVGESVTVNVYGNVYGSGGIDELSDQIARRLRLQGA